MKTKTPKTELKIILRTSLRALGISLLLLSRSVVASDAVDSWETTVIDQLLAGYRASPAQEISRAVDVLLTPQFLETWIDERQEAEARPHLEQIQQRIIGGRVEFDGDQHVMIPSRPLTWRDAHFLDDYSHQTSPDRVTKIAAQYRQVLTKWLQSKGVFKDQSPLSPSLQEKITNANRKACRVLRHL